MRLTIISINLVLKVQFELPEVALPVFCDIMAVKRDDAQIFLSSNEIQLISEFVLTLKSEC